MKRCESGSDISVFPLCLHDVALCCSSFARQLGFLMRKPERLSSQCSDPAQESSGVLSETTDDPQEQNTVSSAVSRTYDQNLNLNWTLVSQRRRRKSDRLCSGSGPEQNMNTEL